MTLTADLRMFRHSGIGRYLRNLFPLLLPLLEADKVQVLLSPSTLASSRTDDALDRAGLQSRHKPIARNPASAAGTIAGTPPHDSFDPPAWLTDPRIELLETSAPIYSLQEQRLLMGIPRNNLLWVPHFNAPLFRRGPMVVTIHDVAPLAMPQILGNSIKRAYAKLLIERAVKQASAILCVSDFTRAELSTRLNVPAGKMTVTSPGLDTHWPATAPPHREADGLPYLLYVGNVKPNKNLALLLEAFTAVLDRLPHRLVLAGKFQGFGTGDAAVLRQAEALGDRARFAGEVSDAELQRLYAGAAALVLPSLYEGFGLPLLEAMRLGCPVLSSTAGSLPEVGGDAALYFDPHSAAGLAACLLRVDDASAMDNLRTLGRARVDYFSFTRCAQQTAAVMNRLLQENSLRTRVQRK